jgi:hypothetical protein
MKYRVYFKYWTNKKSKNVLLECFVNNEQRQIGYSSIECSGDNCFNRVKIRKQLVAGAIKNEVKETRTNIWNELKTKMRICG